MLLYPLFGYISEMTFLLNRVAQIAIKTQSRPMRSARDCFTVISKAPLLSIQAFQRRGSGLVVIFRCLPVQFQSPVKVLFDTQSLFI